MDVRWFILVAVLSLCGLLTACFSPRSEIVPVQPPGTRSPGDFIGLEQFMGSPVLLGQAQWRKLCTQPKVKILIWGQSIAEQFPGEKIRARLNQRFSQCTVEVRNLARGGCSAQCLNGEVAWRAGNEDLPKNYFNSDVLPWQPDVVIFHVYGSHLAYGQLMQRFTQETKAKVLLFTDHVSAQTKNQDWSDTMAWQHLPAIASQYNMTLADSRLAWRQYLYETGLKPETLLSDQVHLNQQGVDLYFYLISHALPVSINNETHQ